MNLVEIEALVEKYYNGETSLEEEKILKKFFLSEDVPEHLLSEKEMFKYIASEDSEILPSPDFDEKIISNLNTVKLKPVSKARSYRNIAIGIAAGIALIFSISYFTGSDSVTITNGIKTSIHTDTNQTNNSDSTKVNSIN